MVFGRRDVVIDKLDKFDANLGEQINELASAARSRQQEAQQRLMVIAERFAAALDDLKVKFEGEQSATATDLVELKQSFAQQLAHNTNTNFRFTKKMCSMRNPGSLKNECTIEDFTLFAAQ